MTVTLMAKIWFSILVVVNLAWFIVFVLSWVWDWR